MAQLRLTLLGSFQVTLDGQPVGDFGTDKARALLAYLAVEADRPRRRDALAGLLWAESPQARARHNLRQTLSYLRQALGDRERTVPFLLVDRQTVRFNPAGDAWLDAAEFAALGAACRRHNHRRIESCRPCLRRMERMADLYGGPFLGGFFLADSTAFEEWATLQREYLQRQMMEALAYLAGYYERRGDGQRAIQAAHRQVQIEPWREEAHRDLMRLLARDGQRSAALAQYRTCRRALADELGIEPTAETSALFARIQDQGLSPAATARRPNLPPAPTPFVGREGELTELAELLAAPEGRLLTLTGPGGIGKTRLALQVAADQVGLFSHGVAFAPLAALSSADPLVPTIADALRFRFHGPQDPEQQLLDFLREKRLLLVLDNMEHLPDGADFVARVLDQAPGVALLVTSRERLNLREEWVYRVEGLAYPPASAGEALETFGAVALFVQTARRLRRSFRLSGENAPPIARICQMVEGLPLAVELAAAWAPTRTCREIADAIEHNLDALTTSLRNVPARHRSLRAAFAHSWNLLSEQERRALRQASFFEGGFDGAAGGQVLAAPVGSLAALVDKSLLRRSALGRYEMHRLIQQVAGEKLQARPQERQIVEERHGAHYAGFLQEREAWFRDARQTEALEAVGVEIENVRLAWRRACAQGRVETIGRSLGSLGAFYAIRSWHQEGAEVFAQAADAVRAGGPPARQRAVVLGACLTWQGHFAHQLGRHREAQQLLRQSLDSLPPDAPRETAFGLYTLGQVACFGLNDYQRGGQLWGESLALYEALDDAYGRAQALDGLGDVAARQGRHDEARTCYEKGLALRREIGDRWGVSASLGSLGGLAGRRGDYAQARRRFEESLAIGRDLENPRGIAASLHNLSSVAYLQGDYVEAKSLRQETLEICREIGYRWGIANALKSLGDVAGQLGEHGQARRFLLESLDILQETGDRRSLAYVLNSLGTVEQAMGDRTASRSRFRQALALAMEIQEPALALDALTSIAELLAQGGDAAGALELVAFVAHHPACEQQTQARLEPLQAEFRAQLPAEIAAQAEARGRILELEDVADQFLTNGPL